MAVETRTQWFRCMACGKEWSEEVDPDKDVERSCPECRSNSVRHLRGRGGEG